MKALITALLVPASFLFISCSSSENLKSEGAVSTPTGLTKIGQLDAVVKESSGLAPAGNQGEFFTQGDAGTEPVLYKINTAGKVVDKVKLPVPNKDWESLAYDDKGNIYVCDCGNNNNDRRDLVVYKVNPANAGQISEIKFSYPDQQNFPPLKKDKNFDSEASLWHNGQLYLFTRDRGQQQTSKVYTIPDSPGTHPAKQVTSLKINGEVTSASLSPDGKTLALLTKESIVLYIGQDLEQLLKATPKVIDTKGAGQTEGSEFTDDQTLIISTEEGGLYKYNL